MASVTVVMSVHNDERNLRPAVASIRTQTLRDWRMIAVDDGSTDQSGAILDEVARADPRVRVIHKPNTGMGESLKVGFEQVETPLAARMDSDDLSAPTRLECLTSYLNSHPDHLLVGTWAWMFSPAFGVYGASIPPDDDGALRAALFAGHNLFIHGSVGFRMAAYRRTTGYRPSLQNASDFDLWLQMSELGKLGTCTSFGYCYQSNPSGLSSLRRHEQIVEARVALQLAQERRASGRETTQIDRSTVERRINQLRVSLEGNAEQLWHFNEGLIHWSAGFNGRAREAFRKAVSANWIGIRALKKILQVQVGWGESPIAGVRAAARRMAPGSDNLGPPYPWEWACEWLEEMGIPTTPYAADEGATQLAVGQQS